MCSYWLSGGNDSQVWFSGCRPHLLLFKHNKGSLVGWLEFHLCPPSASFLLTLTESVARKARNRKVMGLPPQLIFSYPKCKYLKVPSVWLPRWRQVTQPKLGKPTAIQNTVKFLSERDTWFVCVCVCVSFGSLVRYIHAHKCTHMRTWVCVSIIKISLVTHLHIFIIYRFLKGLPVVIVVQLKVKTHKSLLNSAQFLVLFLSFVFVNKWSMRVREQRTQEELFTITLFMRVSCL